jgi:hypothetical protein
MAFRYQLLSETMNGPAFGFASESQELLASEMAGINQRHP